MDTINKSTLLASAMSADDKETLKQLNALVVDCAELRQIEKLLGKFNLFRMLRFEHGEIRHSNVLAWLLQPNESHGLGDSFLRRWLMRIFQDSISAEACRLSPGTIDAVTLKMVTVHREWNFIDLLLELDTYDEGKWIVAVENKVRIQQRPKQLVDYHHRVESAYPKASQRLFIFLTKNDERPEAPCFVSANYNQIFEVLSQCVEEHANVIGEEPKVVLDHYLTILKEYFMQNSEVADLARKIYAKHRRALDVILEHRPDDVQQLTDALEQVFKRSTASTSNLMPMITGKGVLRFLPDQWRTEANLSGKAWGNIGSAHILCELSCYRPAKFEVVVGKAFAPKEWKKELWQKSLEQNFRNIEGAPDNDWLRVYSIKCPIKVNHAEIQDFEAKALELWKWCEQQINQPEFQKVIEVVSDHLKTLPNALAVERNER